MCLVTNSNIPLIAKEDIVVYKVLLHKGNGKDYAPVVADIDLPNYIYKKGVNKARFKEDIVCWYNSTFQISKGFLHAYTSKDLAEQSKITWNEWRKPILHIEYHFVVEMIIPKGTEYFVGVDENDICAKQLIWK